MSSTLAILPASFIFIVISSGRILTHEVMRIFRRCSSRSVIWTCRDLNPAPYLLRRSVRPSLALELPSRCTNRGRIHRPTSVISWERTSELVWDQKPPRLPFTPPASEETERDLNPHAPKGSGAWR